MYLFDLSTDECGRLEYYRFMLDAEVIDTNSDEDIFKQLIDKNKTDFISFTDADGDHHVFALRCIVTFHLLEVPDDAEVSDDDTEPWKEKD